MAWHAAQYLDDDRWGIVDDENEIIVGVSARMTRERAEEICALRASRLRLARSLIDAEAMLQYVNVACGEEHHQNVAEAHRIVLEEKRADAILALIEPLVGEREAAKLKEGE